MPDGGGDLIPAHLTGFWRWGRIGGEVGWKHTMRVSEAHLHEQFTKDHGSLTEAPSGLAIIGAEKIPLPPATAPYSVQSLGASEAHDGYGQRK